ncbi:MAG: DUF1738 domain-containing protein [Alphaproteobacteria bacterium]|nr:DUF1738 domain-containing protein [Alphaproteobacteria bacterium]
MAQVLKIGDGSSGSKRAGRTRDEVRARCNEPRASLYDEVTARIVTELEAGRFPWVQPWDSAVACPGLPRNAVTGRSYPTAKS